MEVLHYYFHYSLVPISQLASSTANFVYFAELCSGSSYLSRVPSKLRVLSLTAKGNFNSNQPSFSALHLLNKQIFKFTQTYISAKSHLRFQYPAGQLPLLPLSFARIPNAFCNSYLSPRSTVGNYLSSRSAGARRFVSVLMKNHRFPSE